MSEFINTIDLLGDEVVLNSIIDRSITEFKDNLVTLVGNNTFRNCAALTSVVLPNVTSIGNYAFNGCAALTSVDLTNVTILGTNACYGCAELDTLILRSSSTICLIPNSYSLYGTKIASGTGYIYVPSALKDQYASANYWKSYQFRALEDYTVDGTTTGELDTSKI